jgi:hypothetical protein
VITLLVWLWYSVFVGGNCPPTFGDSTMTKLSYKAFSIDTEAVAPAGIEYLLQYGFAQSMQDCIAGRAKAVREELAEKMKQPDAIQLTDAEIEAAVEADLKGALGKRMDAILAGTVAVRQAAEAKDPASGIVRELLVAWAKSKGGKLPQSGLRRIQGPCCEDADREGGSHRRPSWLAAPKPWPISISISDPSTTKALAPPCAGLGYWEYPQQEPAYAEHFHCRVGTIATLRSATESSRGVQSNCTIRGAALSKPWPRCGEHGTRALAQLGRRLRGRCSP